MKPTPCEHGKDKSWCVKCNRGEPKKPTPEEKCSHEWIQKTGLGYHCRKCRTAKIRPSPSPEARVDWEKWAEEVADPIIKGDDVIGGFEIRTYHRALKVIQAAFEKGREER